MTTKTTSTTTTKRNLSNRTHGIRRSLLRCCLLLGASSLALAGCVGDAVQASEELVQTDTTAEIAPVTPAPSAKVESGARLVRVGMEKSAAQRKAEYRIDTASGKRFKTTVTHRVQRDGADEVITAEDLDTGKVVSWAFGAESAAYTADDGSVANLSGDDDAETLTLLAGGESTTLDFAGVVEGSEEEAGLISIAVLATMGSAAFSEDQIDALAAALAASEQDLGASSMGWGWVKKAAKSVAKGLKSAYCSEATSVVCGVIFEAGLDATFISASAGCAPVAVGSATVTVLAAGCLVGQAFACH